MSHSNIAGMYHFTFRGEQDKQRTMTLHTRCHCDLPSQSSLEEDGVSLGSVREKGNTGLVLTIGASGCGLDVSKAVARSLSCLGEAVLQNEAEKNAYFVPEGLTQRPELSDVLIEQKASLYDASGIVTSLMLSGRKDEVKDLAIQIENAMDIMPSKESVKKGSFEKSRDYREIELSL